MEHILGKPKGWRASVTDMEFTQTLLKLSDPQSKSERIADAIKSPVEDDRHFLDAKYENVSKAYDTIQD